MKCEQVKLNILRADTGELGSWQTRVLERHLGACADCRHYRDDLRQLTEATRVEPQPAVDTFAMRMLLNEARRVSVQRGVPSLGTRLLGFFQTLEIPALRPALAVATAFLLVVGGVLVAQKVIVRTAWNDDVDQQIERLQDTLVSLSTDDLPHAGANDLENIACELLEVEG